MSRRAGGTLPGIGLLGVVLTGGPAAAAGATELCRGRGVVLVVDITRAGTNDRREMP